MDIIKRFALNALGMALMLALCAAIVPPLMYGLHKIMSPEAAMLLVFLIAVVTMTVTNPKK